MILKKSPQAEAYILKITRRLEQHAIAIFLSSSKHSNDALPEGFEGHHSMERYVSQFRITYHRDQLKATLTNHDAGWNLIEYGGHAGGKTFVLRYRPMGRALEMMTAEHI
jgi:hypothetical protein